MALKAFKFKIISNFAPNLNITWWFLTKNYYAHVKTSPPNSKTNRTEKRSIKTAKNKPKNKPVFYLSCLFNLDGEGGGEVEEGAGPDSTYLYFFPSL